MPIREDEWLAELERLTRANADGFSTADISIAMGLSPRSVREKLAMAIRLGVLVLAGYRNGTSIDGKRCRVPVYRSVAKKKSRR